MSHEDEGTDELPLAIGQHAERIVTNLAETRKENAMKNAVEIMPNNHVADYKPSAMTPMDMLNVAVSQGAGIEVLEKLMALQERWEANQARKDFDEAIALAKAEISPVVRNAKGHNDKRYADFSAIARAVDPIITKFGLSYRFRTNQTDKILVTCVLSHKSGHSEETTLAGPPDASGSKNAIQAIGSTLSYLQRYSLVQALGLSASNDDDGRVAGRMADDVLTKEQVTQLLSELDMAEADTERFCKHYQIDAVPDLPASKFNAAIAAIRRTADARRQANG